MWLLTLLVGKRVVGVAVGDSHTVVWTAKPLIELLIYDQNCFFYLWGTRGAKQIYISS